MEETARRTLQAVARRGARRPRKLRRSAHPEFQVGPSRYSGWL